MRAVKVYGQLAERLGQRVFRADVSSPAEAIRFLCANFLGLEQWLIDTANDGIGFRVMVGRTKVGEDDFALSCNPDATISITPVLTGAGGSTSQILVGVGLIAASFLLPGAGLFGTVGLGGTLAAGSAAAIPAVGAIGVAGGAFATFLGTAFSAIGASMVLSGAASLLTPSASLTNPAAGIAAARDAARLQSYNFSGIQNTSVQGASIPLVYGKIYTGSIVLSASIATTEL